MIDLFAVVKSFHVYLLAVADVQVAGVGQRLPLQNPISTPLRLVVPHCTELGQIKQIPV